MFEDYLQDSFEFLTVGQSLAKQKKDREARRFYRASIFYAAGAIEAFVNYIADSFAQAKNIPQCEIDFLNDKISFFSVPKGPTSRLEYHKLDDKLRVLMARLAPKFDFKSLTWNKFMEFKKFRDSLVHPRQVDDETSLLEYESTLRAGLRAIIELMNLVSKGMFRKPLRRQLLDLIPE